MNDEKYKNQNIVVSINGIETNRISKKQAIGESISIKYLIMQEIQKSPEIKAVDKFFVRINGKIVIPREVKNFSIEDVKTIEIFDERPLERLEKRLNQSFEKDSK